MEDKDGVRYTDKGQDIFNRELDKVASILHNYGIIETIELQKSTAKGLSPFVIDNFIILLVLGMT